MFKRMTAKVIFILTVMLILVPGVSAEETKVFPDQITVVYDSPNRCISDYDIDFTRIKYVESVTASIEVLRLKEKTDALEIIRTLDAEDGILAVDYEAEAKADGFPNDSYYKSDQSYLKMIGYPNVSVGREQVKVAILDTGIDPNHEDLKGRVELSGYDFISNSKQFSDRKVTEPLSLEFSLPRQITVSVSQVQRERKKSKWFPTQSSIKMVEDRLAILPQRCNR